MIISGLQKMTLLDYPGRVACTVFLQGCNFRCPFCHNSRMLTGNPAPVMETEAFFGFLKSRRGLLDGVCVSGGEPTLRPELPDFLVRIKEMGFSVKLDTNGSRPEILKDLVARGLIDHVAMDVKNSPARYAETVGTHVDLSAIEESLRFLIEGTVSYELRTTLVQPLHDAASIQDMGQWIAHLVPGKLPRQLYLQRFVDRETVLFSGLSAPEEEVVLRFADILSPFAHKVAIRGE